MENSNSNSKNEGSNQFKNDATNKSNASDLKTMSSQTNNLYKTNEISPIKNQSRYLNNEETNENSGVSLNVCQFVNASVLRNNYRNSCRENYYRAMGCVTPYLPTHSRDGYMTFRTPPSFYPRNNPTNTQHKNTPCKVQMFQFLEVALKRILFHLAKSSVQYKYLFRIFPIILTSLTLIALILIQPNFNLFLPFDLLITNSKNKNLFDNHFISATVAALSSIENKFNGTNPNFDAPKFNSYHDFSIIFQVKNSQDNVLSKRTVYLYKKLSDQIRQINVTNSLEILEWNDLCRENCEENRLISALQNNQLLLKYPEAVLLNENKSQNFSTLFNIDRIFTANVVGDVKLDSDGIITQAGSLLLSIKLKETLTHEILIAFEQNLEKILKNFILLEEFQTSNLLLNYWSFRNYNKEVLTSLSDIVFKLLISFIFFAVTAMAIFGFYNCNSYKNRPFVAIQIIIIVLISIIVSYAVNIIGIGGAFNIMLFPTIFIIVSISILMFFAAHQCFTRYSMIALHPIEKLAFIYSWDMSCFLGTAFVLSFSAATLAWFTENSYLCQSFLFLATSLASVLIYGIFYLTIFLYNAEKREVSGLKWYHLYKKGDETFNDKVLYDYDELICHRLHDKLTNSKPCFSNWMGHIAGNYNIRTIFAILFILYIVFTSLNLFNGTERFVQLKKEHFIKENLQSFKWGNSAKFLNNFNNGYEKSEDYLELVFELPVDYYNRRNKEHIFNMIRWTLDNNYATKAESWLIDFENFQRNTEYDVNIDTIVPIVKFVFLQNESYRKYSSDLVFDKFQTQILKSRMYLELTVKGLSMSSTLIDTLEKRAKAANLPLNVVAPYLFLLKHDRQVFSIIIPSFIILLICLTLISIIFFTYPIVCICLPFSCICTSIGVCGVAQYFSIPINMITLSTLLLGNFYTAAVTIYFCFMFNNSCSSHKTNLKRIKYAFQCTFWPTTLSSLSLLIFYLPLLINASPFTVHIFKVLIGVAVVTYLNYMCFLPNLVIILTKNISSCSSSINKFCDSKSCEIEQSQDGIYYLSNSANNFFLPHWSDPLVIAPFYSRENYNNLSILPPAYDYRQQMIINSTLPAIPPPTLPTDFNNTTNESNNSIEKDDKNLRNAKTNYNQQQSPNRQRNNDRVFVNENTDSNCNSLDSRNATNHCQFNGYNNTQTGHNILTSSYHPTSSHNNKENNQNNSPSTSCVVPQKNTTKFKNLCYMRRDSSQVSSSKFHTNEQIYEEPEYPIAAYIQRSQSDPRYQNVLNTNETSSIKTKKNNHTLTEKSNFYDQTNNIRQIKTKKDNEIQPKLINYKNNNLSKTDTQVINHKNFDYTPSPSSYVLSPPSNKKKYRF